MAAEGYVQVGVTALRGPKGEFLPAVPLYVRSESGAEEAERELIRFVMRIRLFALFLQKER